jgi:flagellar motility protein MotE (MotC chaperone)
MEIKQILTASAIILGTFVLIVGSVVGIYFLYPEVLGFAPPQVRKDKIAKDSASTKFDSLALKKQNDSSELAIPYDSLKNIAFALKDSLRNKKDALKIYNDSISGLVKRIIQLDNNESKITDSVNIVKRQMSKAMDDLQQLKKSVGLKDSLNAVKADSMSIKNLVQFAKIYNNVAPTEVAKILEKIENRKDVAKIIKLMQPRKAGKVLESMKPEMAADILLQGSIDK